MANSVKAMCAVAIILAIRQKRKKRIRKHQFWVNKLLLQH